MTKILFQLQKGNMVWYTLSGGHITFLELKWCILLILIIIIMNWQVAFVDCFIAAHIFDDLDLVHARVPILRIKDIIGYVQ